MGSHGQGRVQVTDLRSGVPLTQIQQGTEGVPAVSRLWFSPDGLLTVGSPGIISRWDLSGGREVFRDDDRALERTPTLQFSANDLTLEAQAVGGGANGVLLTGNPSVVANLPGAAESIAFQPGRGPIGGRRPGCRAALRYSIA